MNRRLQGVGEAAEDSRVAEASGLAATLGRVAMGILMLYAFAVPWEYSLDLGEPVGNVARVLGVGLLAVGIPAVLAAGGIRRLGAMQWLVLGFYLYFAVSYLWTVDPEATLEKIRAYFQVMMVVWMVWELARAPEELRGVLRAYVAGNWVLAILTVMNFAAAGSDGASAAEQIRFVAEGQDPNDVARFLDLGFPFATLLFATERRWAMRLLAIGYLPLGLLAVLLTASRGGFSAAVIAAVGSAVLLVIWRPQAGAWVFAGLTGTVAALWMLVPIESLERLATIPEQVGGGDWNDRLNIWTAGWRAFAREPVWGYGAGTFPMAADLAPGDTAHNTIMAVMVTGGLVAAAGLMGILVVAAGSILRTRGLLRVALGTAMLVWVITSMVGSVEENRTTWLLFAVMAVAGRFASEDEEALEEVFSGRRLAHAVG